MAEQIFPADVDHRSARAPRYWQRRVLIAVLCVVAAAGFYAAWPRDRARELSALSQRFGQSSGCAFFASETSVTGRGIVVTDELAQNIASVRTISSVDFSACALSSDGFKAITSLPSLSNLSLVDCRFAGPGKVRFGASQSLAQVTLKNTNLSGSDLARFLSEQPRLEMMMLDANSLTDSDLKGWNAPTELSRAVIREHSLTAVGLAGLAHCQSLEALSLASSGIDDKGLVGFAPLKSLKSLDLTGCRALDGSGLAHLAPLDDLVDLDLSKTLVTDRGLQCLGSAFPALSQVQLQGCDNITDAAFESLAQLPRLRLLDLTGTKVTGRGLRFFDGHKALGTMILSNTHLDDDGLSTLGRLPALRDLDLSHTRIAGGTLAALKRCPQLEGLSIAGCSVSRQAVKGLSLATPSLQRLDCSGCAAIDDETIEALSPLRRLRIVRLAGTRVFGSWNSRVPIADISLNGLSTLLTNAEIDEAAAADLSPGGRLRALTLDHCRLSAKALKIATSAPALRILTLDRCTVLENKAGQLGALERLESLTIRNTQIEPADLSRVCSGDRIHQFVLEGRTITEAALSAWTGARSAESLEIKGGHFGSTRLRGLRNCVKLVNLDLSNSDATDRMLQDLQGLNSLGTINLAGCKQFTDGGLAYLVAVPQLWHLNLSGTGITGHRLMDLKPCEHLMHLNLAETRITDHSIAAAEFPPSLWTLSVAKTDIHGAGLASLCKRKGFGNVDASGSNVDDAGLKIIAAIPALSSLDLSHCANITDAGVRQLATMSNLADLNLRGTKTGDGALEAIAAMPKLRTLNLRETQVTAQGVRKLSSCPVLTTLEADETTLPPSLLREIVHPPRQPMPARRL